MAKYSKFIIAIVGAVIAGINLYYGDANPEWVGILIAVVTALGVYQVPNKAV